MSIKTRLALLVGLLLLAFVAVLTWLRQREHGLAEAAQRDALQTGQTNVRLWVDLTNQPLQRFAADYGTWPELAAYLRLPAADWAAQNLQAVLANYQAHALWLLDDHGRLAYSARQKNGAPLPRPLAAADWPALLAAPRHYFYESRDGLLEIWSHPVTAAPGAPPAGVLLVSRLWDSAYVDTLSRLSTSALQLQPAGTTAGHADPGTRRLPLTGPDGAVVRQLQLRPSLPQPGDFFTGGAATARVFVAFGLLLLLAVWLGLRRWVVQPLNAISASLQYGNPGLIHALLPQKNELGRVAQLVDTAFQQKAALVGEIADRARAEDALRRSQDKLRHAQELHARLARDLHDGVIQSIYAAGLGLESALAEIEHDPAAARQRCLLCRQSLNDIIRDVRGFISGLEPAAITPQSFPEAIDALVHTMQAMWPVAITSDLEPAAARLLTTAQEVHLLQIARESLSNALRHGEARQVQLSLRVLSHRLTFVIRDHGRGFDPDATASRGHGLRNLHARAAEMGGTCQISSAPGTGTTVTISFATPPPIL